MERLLTKGSLKSMMNNEEVKYPILQVLGVRKITATGRKERYRLIISDGQNIHSYAILATQLNHMIFSDELIEFAILRIKHYLISTLTDHSNRIEKIIIFIDLDILVHGNNVKQIGDPKPVFDHSNQSKLSGNQFQNMKYEKLLTKGSLSFIINNEEIKNPVMQVIGTTKITAVGIDDIYCLIISDGQNYFSYVPLTTQLKNMISSGELTKFSIVLINRYILNNPKDCIKESKQMLFLIDVVVLVSGDIVGLKIGDPTPIINNSVPIVGNNSATSVKDNVIDRDLQIDLKNIYLVDLHDLYNEVEHRTVLTMDPRLKYGYIGCHFRREEYEIMLTTGCLKSIINNNYNSDESIMQILDIQLINYDDYERYCLNVSDGYNSHSFVMLASELNDMVLTGILDKYAIVWITKHTVNKYSPTFRKIKTQVVVLVDLVVLVCGVRVGSKISDPKPIINSEKISDPLIKQQENCLLQCFDYYY